MSGTTTNTQTVFTFNENQIRTFKGDDGQIWFIAKDVCNSLGLENVSSALTEIDQEDKTDLTGNKIGIKVSKLRAVNEPGLYNLIFKSRKPEAKKFKKWVTAEVLPQIRKTGQYTKPETEGAGYCLGTRDFSGYGSRLVTDTPVLNEIMGIFFDLGQYRFTAPETVKLIKNVLEKYDIRDKAYLRAAAASHLAKGGAA